MRGTALPSPRHLSPLPGPCLLMPQTGSIPRHGNAVTNTVREREGPFRRDPAKAGQRLPRWPNARSPVQLCGSTPAQSACALSLAACGSALRCARPARIVIELCLQAQGSTEALYRSRVKTSGASAALDQSSAPVPDDSQGGCRPALRGISPPLLILEVLAVFRLIVAGSRSFADYARLAADLDRLLVNRLPSVEIVCGGCSAGADALAARYARERGLALRVFPAQWRLYGAAAGPFRNAAMAAYGSALVAYWDGASSGTASMLRCASAQGLRVVLRRF